MCPVSRHVCLMSVPTPVTSCHYEPLQKRGKDGRHVPAQKPGNLTGPGPHSQLCSRLSYFTPKLGVTPPYGEGREDEMHEFILSNWNQPWAPARSCTTSQLWLLLAFSRLHPDPAPFPFHLSVELESLHWGLLCTLHHGTRLPSRDPTRPHHPEGRGASVSRPIALSPK